MSVFFLCNFRSYYPPFLFLSFFFLFIWEKIYVYSNLWMKLGSGELLRQFHSFKRMFRFLFNRRKVESGKGSKKMSSLTKTAIHCTPHGWPTPLPPIWMLFVFFYLHYNFQIFSYGKLVNPMTCLGDGTSHKKC